MAELTESPDVNIDTDLVRKLIDSQFPQWSGLPINPVVRSGWDNRTFRLGQKLLVRMPSAEHYAPQVMKERRWLPFLAERLSTSIPFVQAHGSPEHGYPWSWSVYRWIEGDDVDANDRSDSIQFAESLAQFISELHDIEPSDGPVPGRHNYYRGGSLSEYDAETRSNAVLLQNEICVDTALSIWNNALNTQWLSKSVWVHGDLEATNILVREGHLVAVIDFGNCAVGDPACDLVMAWTYFEENARKVFQSSLTVDDHTWQRARAWALWKALFRMSRSLELRNDEYHAAKKLADVIMLSDG